MIANRIKSIMDHYDLSIKGLADKVGVQRSSVSHILNGRNRPGLDFVVKLLAEFPEIESSWLLHGKGEMVTNVSPPVSETPESTGTPATIGDTDVSNDNIFGEGEPSDTSQSTTDKRAQRVIIFYDDGTFEEYEKR